MTMKFREMAGGDPIRSNDWNRLVNEVERLGRFTVEPPLELVNQDQGLALRLSRGEFWAVIADPSGGSSSSSASCLGVGQPYAWKEVEPHGDGTWDKVGGGRSGTTTVNPAYEINGACLAVGTVVYMRPGLLGEYICEFCCGSTGTPSSSSSSSPSSSVVSSSSSPVSSSSLSSQSSLSSSSQSSSSTHSSSQSSRSSSGSSNSSSGSSCLPCGAGQTSITVVVGVTFANCVLTYQTATICLPAGTTVCYN